MDGLRQSLPGVFAEWKTGASILRHVIPHLPPSPKVIGLIAALWYSGKSQGIGPGETSGTYFTYLQHMLQVQLK